MADINAIAKQFTDFYYQTFDTDRSGLAGLYRNHSMLSFEGAQFQGTQTILEKLTNLPFQKVQHKVGTIDTQPTGESQSSLFVLVTGALVVDDGENPLNFTQAFTLVPEGQQFYVYNDVFRLSFG